MLVLFPSKNTKNSSVAMAMQRFFEFFKRFYCNKDIFKLFYNKKYL